MTRTFRARAVALLLALAALFSLAGCAKTVGKYRVLKTFDEESYRIGFRLDDQVATYIDAALRALAADGTVHRLAMEWMGQDETLIEPDAQLLKDLGSIPKRTLIIGVSDSSFPLSYSVDGGFDGFDIALARAACEKLGWDVRFQAVAPSDVYVQLSSGNVDCVWGGMSLDDVNLTESGKEKPRSQQLALSAAYLKNQIVLISRADSRISSTLRLRGQSVMLDSGERYITALQTDSRLVHRCGSIERVNGGAQQCFAALQNAECAAIVTDSVALAYYNK
ncbi:MAG: transporter substrate-binding domain-containing protein [Oscillospiraceae bacterium]|nr:transporter substrate-binding domain-containing protein [Oscillospiraceae bacterium]